MRFGNCNHDGIYTNGRFYFWRCPEVKRPLFKNLCAINIGYPTLCGSNHNDFVMDTSYRPYKPNNDGGSINTGDQMTPESFIRSQTSLLVTLLLCVMISMMNDDNEANA